MIVLDQLQDVFLESDIHERIVVHRLLKIDQVQTPDLIFSLLSMSRSRLKWYLSDPLRQYTGTLVALHQVGLHEKARLASTRTTDNQNVLIPWHTSGS